MGKQQPLPTIMEPQKDAEPPERVTISLTFERTFWSGAKSGEMFMRFADTEVAITLAEEPKTKLGTVDAALGGSWLVHTEYGGGIYAVNPREVWAAFAEAFDKALNAGRQPQQ